MGGPMEQTLYMCLTSGFGLSFTQLHVNAKCCELVIHPVFGSADLEANPFEPPTGQRARRRRRSEIRHQKTNTASLFPCLASNFPVLAAAPHTCACCMITQFLHSGPSATSSYNKEVAVQTA